MIVFAVATFAMRAVFGKDLSLEATDWLSFAGALIGASVTVAGGIYILDRERHREDRLRAKMLKELLDDIDSNCTPFQLTNAEALKNKYDVTPQEQVDKLCACVRRVWEFAKILEPRTVRDLKILDAIAAIELPENQLRTEAAGIARYPKSADLGELNAIAHTIGASVKRIKGLL